MVDRENRRLVVLSKSTVQQLIKIRSELELQMGTRQTMESVQKHLIELYALGKTKG